MCIILPQRGLGQAIKPPVIARRCSVCLGLAVGGVALVLVAACADRSGGDAPPGDRTDAATAGDRPLLPDGEDPTRDDAGADAALDAARTGCPAGSTLRHTRSTCPGAALAAPTAFASDLAAAAPGDVLSLAGLAESTAPCLPVVVCTPADAPTLVFSDSPESPAQDGVLYADTVNAGRYRLYVYHANGDTVSRKFPVVVLNQGTLPAKVTIVRRGLGVPSTAYVALGKSVLLDWFIDRPAVDVTVAPGQRVLLDAALDQLHAAPDELVHAIYDVVIDRPVKLSFVSVKANADAAATAAGLSLLTRDATHQRGTFVAADVLVVPADVPGGAQKAGVQRLRLGLDETDETLEGTDVTTGDKQRLSGNYGMLYRFAFGTLAPARLAVAPRGGGWGGVARVADASVRLPATTEQLATTTDVIAAGATPGETKLMTGGGSNLPVDLLLVTPP